MKKEVRQLVREMIARGWEFSLRSNNHVKLQHPCGAFIITSSTPSDGRALLNARADIKRIERNATKGESQCQMINPTQ